MGHSECVKSFDLKNKKSSLINFIEKENYYREWTNIINALKGFQCIAVWVPFNEAWGQFDTEIAVDLTRRLDPTRLVNEASGGNYSLCGDIQDVHHYQVLNMKIQPLISDNI